MKKGISKNPDVEQAIGLYLEQVKRRLFGAQKNAATRRTQNLLLLPSGISQRLLECEQGQAWERLTGLFGQSWGEISGEGVLAPFVHPPWRDQLDAPLIWNPANDGLKNWFRRTGVYTACLNGRKINPSRVSAHLMDSTVRHCTEETVTYLALLDGLAFARDSIDCGAFRIWRPTAPELDRILEVHTNRLFFPQAIPTADPFTRVWYVEVKELAKKPSAIVSEINREQSSKKTVRVDDDVLAPKFSAFPYAVRQALQQLLLWPRWRCDYAAKDLARRPFQVAFILTIYDCPFERPLVAPRAGISYYQPLPPLRFIEGLLAEFESGWNEVDEQAWDDWVDKHPEHGGSGFSWRSTTDWRLTPIDPLAPVYDIERFDENLTMEFEHRMRTQFAELCKVRAASDWSSFLELTLNFMVKGYEFDGLESLLWYVVSLESLLGDQQHPTREIGSRLDTLLPAGSLSEGAGRGSIPTPKKRFEKLYDFRCSLVHGRPAKESARQEHVVLAYRLASLAAGKLIHLLSEILIRVQHKALPEIPSRSELLEEIDRVNARKTTLYPLANAIREILSGG